MDVDSKIKKKAFSGAIWKLLERIIAQAVSLIVSIVLARLLTPEDYSVVSIVTIFFTFSDVLITGGLNTALIQKTNADKEDYSTAFWLSMIMSIFLYFVMFFCAPYISKIYDREILIPVIRVMAIILPINAAKSIVCANISSSLNFKSFFIATIWGTIISAFVGIIMAYNGFGAWALVVQQMTNALVDTLLLYCRTKISFSFGISIIRFKCLWSYGWKVLVSSLIGVAYNEINPLFIGLRFSPESLSFYDKGRSFPLLISSATTNTLSSVLFPFLSKFQNNKRELLNYTRKYISLTSYVVFPAMMGLFAVCDKFVLLLLTDKWIEIVPFIRIFCFAYMFDMINIGNCETIKAMGRSDIYLIIEIIKKICYFIVIGIFLIFAESAITVACASLICTVIAITVNSIPNKKLIGYSFLYQMQDLFPNFITSAFMGIFVWWIGKLIKIAVLPLLVIQVVSGILFYIFLSMIIKNKNYFILFKIIKDYFTDKKDEI